MKKIILWILGSVFVLTLLTVGAITYVINFVFTPEKLTPLVERLANENLDARLSIKSVELTFFSTFPNFSLALDSGAVMSKTVDSTLKSDTIVSFDRINIAVNPIALVRYNEVVVHQIALLKPRIYAAILPNGSANWDVFETSTAASDTNGVVDTTVNKSLNLTLSDIRITDGNIIFDDRASQLYAVVEDVTMRLSGDLSASMADMMLGLSFRNGLLWERGELLFNGIDFSTNASMGIDTTSKRLIVRQSDVDLNNIKLTIDGNITPDSVDMKLALQVPSLETVLDILPLKKEAAKLTSTGSVDFEATIHGAYKGGNVPVVDAAMSIEDATARYSGFRYGIDNLTVNAVAHLDMSRRSASYINLEKFQFKGASTLIDLTGRATNLLGNPKFNFKTKSKLNLTELAATFPLADSIALGGSFAIEGQGEVDAEQLRRADYATIAAMVRIDVGSVRFKVGREIDAQFDTMNIYASNNSDGLLNVKGSVRALNVQTLLLHSSLSSADFDFQGVRNIKDSTSFMRGAVNYASFQGATHGDSVMVRSGRSIAELTVNQKLGVKVETDSLVLKVLKNHFSMNAARLDGSLGKGGEFTGSIGFAGVELFTPLFPLPMSMPATSVSVNNHDVMLHKAIFRVGESDMMITGRVSNLVEASLGQKPLVVRVDISSDNLNLTQIIHTLNTTERGGNATEVTVAESVPANELTLVAIPKNLDFELNTKLSVLEFGALSLTDIHGVVSLKDGLAKLNDLSFTTLGARLSSTLVYDNRVSDSTAQVGMMLSSRSIDVRSVIELIPSLDTIVPMMNSFEGKIDFSMIADTRLGDGFVLNPKDIRAVVSFSGEDLVLLDGQTFAEISKMLMFKNKKRNVVDSVGVQLSINDGAVEVFPFIIQLDRYRAAVGGQHYFNNNFDYHISVLKSPIPFKFGINISGSLDKMKVGIGKTKYKFMNEPMYVKSLNPKYIDLGRDITEAIRKL